jgi:hypothetical protein
MPRLSPGTWVHKPFRLLKFAILFLCLMAAAPQLFAVPDDSTAADSKALHDLQARMEQLESRVHALEAENATLRSHMAASTATTASATAVVPPSEEPTSVVPPPTSQANPSSMPMAADTPHLQMRGYADIRYSASNLPGSTNSFTLGQFNLFINSKLSDKFSVLSEVVTEADSATNQFGIELERLLLNYHYSDNFNVGFGRYHTSIGYYNTAYHHSAWMQTTVDRPFLFAFEDGGGILPIHNVGVTASGAIASGSLGLHYVAELGNGRATRTEFGQNPVQNVHDENNGKSFNFALFARPESVRGLQFGASGYHDHLTPLNGPNVDEVILSAHAVYIRPSFEFLNEAILIRHSPDNGLSTVNAPAFYSQISRRWGAYRPYFRYEYVNVPDRDLIFPDVHRLNGPVLGLRYDWGEFTAFKIQYGRTMRRVDPSYNTLTLQTSFAF